MKYTRWSREWKSSAKPVKQRRYVRNAPYHAKKNLCSASLAKELRKKYGKRSMVVRKGDKVRIMTGAHSGKVGKVNEVEVKKTRIFIDGIDATKKDGNKVFVPIHPSNVQIIELELGDKMRMAVFDRKTPSQKQEKKVAAPKQPEKKEEKKAKK